MKILGIVASPRKGGNTDTLIDRVLEGAKGGNKNVEVEKLYLRDLDISPCQACFTCEATRKCVIPDDMQMVSAKLQEADGVVLGGPKHMSLSTELTTFLTRMRDLVSYIDLLVRPLPPSEEEALSKERACLDIWKNGNYAETTSRAEDMMIAAIKEYTLKHGSHPIAASRLKKGKKLVFILSYWHYGEMYKEIIEGPVIHVLETIMGFNIADVIHADRVLKKGDAQKRDDLMERAFKAGQLLSQGI